MWYDVLWYDVLQFRFLSRWRTSTKNENLCKYMMNSPPIVPRSTCHKRTTFHLVLSRLRETHLTTKYGNGKIPASDKIHSPSFRAPATNYLLSCLRVSRNQPTREVRQRGNARLRQVHSLSFRAPVTKRSSTLSPRVSKISLNTKQLTPRYDNGATGKHKRPARKPSI